jgi:flagellar protein FlaG
MIIQSVNASQSALPGRVSGNDAPAVAATPAQVPVQAPAQATAQATVQPPTAAQLKSAVDSINRAMQQSNQSLEFSVDPTTKTPVVKMTDKETGKVISQYPSEQVLAIAQSIDEFLSAHQLQQGMLLQQKA